MSRFLVGPPSETSWTLDPEALTLHLRSRWPEIEVRPQDPESLASLSFRVPVDGEYPPLAHLLTPGHTVTLEGGLHESAEFAAWLRQIAPPEQALLFYDQGFSFDVALTPGITREEIISAATEAAQVPGGACPYCSALSRALDANDYLMGDGVTAIWADGFRVTDASILCAKAVGPDPSQSPWVADSAVPERLRRLAHQAFEHEIARFQGVWADPSTPVRGLEIVTDDARAVPVLEAILSRWEVPSRVVVHG